MIKNNLFAELNFNKNKFLYYKKKYSFELIKKNINKIYQTAIKNKKGVVALNTKNKLDFLIKLYALNKAGFVVFITNTNSENFLKKEKIKINYFFKKNKFTNIKKTKYPLDKKISLIFKTSGSTDVSKYVFLSNDNISFITSEMNKKMFLNTRSQNELIFAPIDHAFGFGRLHSLLKSNHSITLVDKITLSKFYNTCDYFNCTCASIPSNILMALIDLDYKNFKKKISKFNYLHTSTSYLPINYRKKFKNLNCNLFINYGMTEAMRSTFLDCKKYPKKIHTEGKPFKGINLKIDKKYNTYGNIFIKGRNLTLGYSDKKLWKSRFINGWFSTGDLGYLDKDGFLIFYGRDKDNINYNGINYNLKQIEKYLKKRFFMKNLKIINISKKRNSFDSKLFLFIDKNLKENLIYKYLKSKKIFITFEKIIKTKKFIYNRTGKINTNNFIKKINEKSN